MPRRSRVAAAGLLAAASLVAAQPCDIYAIGNTPCVAAHSTTRALYKNFNGALYQVTRSSDHSTKDITTLSTGGIANGPGQDTFCNGTSCTITIIYDQSGNGNHLTPAPPGGAAAGPGPNGYDIPADATLAPVYLNGHKVYGVFSNGGGVGYRNDNTRGIATGDEPEGMYAIFDGTHYSGQCCYDYGNAETNNRDNGNGHMEAIYFGKGDGSGRGTGSGPGPWVMGDLENLLADGYDLNNNPNLPTIPWRFVTAIVKGEPNHWAIRGGDSTNGGLFTWYDGVRPDASGYYPMSKEGAIILGIGGDNSDGGAGTFYEGAMTSGYPEDNIEAFVQADIVQNAKYSA